MGAGGGGIPHKQYRSSTLVGPRHPEMVLQPVLRYG